MTVYGADEDAYERVTGHRAFNQVIGAIRHVHEVNLPLHVNITPNRYLTAEGVEMLVRLLCSMKISFGVNAGLSDPREATGRAEDIHDLSLTCFLRVAKYLRKQEGELVRPVNLESLPRPGGMAQEAAL